MAGSAEALAPLPEEPPRPLRVILREFVQEVIEGEDVISTQDLIRRALVRFADDWEFQRAAARDVIASLIPEILDKAARDQKASIVRTSSGAVSRRRVEATAREKLGMIMEGMGGGLHKSLLNLRKRELLELNARDNDQIRSMSRWVGLRADLAGRMTDKQVVGDLSSRVLDQAWRRYLGSDETE